MTHDTDRSDRFHSQITSAQLSQCAGCKYWSGNRECKAFDGQKVPLEIVSNEFDHREPHPQDNGRQYEPKDDGTEHPMNRQRSERPS